jgi:Na+/proline symporter
MKPASMSRTFLWAGLWFYPIPLCMGLLGLIGPSQGVTMEDLGADGAGAIGPYVITHLGIPTVLVALYVTIILQACYSTIDGAFSALSSLVATDVVKPRWPQMPDKQLLRITKGSIIAGGVVGGIVVLASNDYINTVNTIYFFKGALILPLTFAIFWKRTTAPAFVAAIFVAAIAGYLVRENVDELWGTATLLSSSLLVLVLGSAFSRSTFEYARLERVNRDDTPEPVLTAKADRS